jgi:hypothetical protein
VRRAALVIIVAVLVAAASNVPANAAGTPAAQVRIVYPTGKFPKDHKNVQAAVDLGGTVLLKTTNARGVPTAFNFGPANDAIGGQVDLTTDVAVVGERAGPNMTTIRGGFIPFFGTDPVKTRIQGISFDAPMLSAIIITRSTGAEIVDNRVARVVGEPLVGFLGVPPLTEGRGIKFLGNGDPDADITGTVRVVGNVIDDMHADLSDAIVFDAVAADIEVSDNRVGTTRSSGVLVINSSGAVTITSNHITPGPGDPGVRSFGDGIDVVGSRGAQIEIAGNEITCENPAADGIYLAGGGSFGEIDGAAITDNVIRMKGSVAAAIALEDAVSRSVVASNAIEGAANYAIDLRQVAGGKSAVTNVLRDNDIGSFDAAGGDVFLDRHSRSTRVVGSDGTVTDMGTDNTVEGLTAFPLRHAQSSVRAKVLVPATGAGTMVEPATAKAFELDIKGSPDGFDNARIEVLATPTVAADLDLYLQRKQPDGSWLTVGTGANSDLDKEHISARRQPAGRYRVLVHNWSGGPQRVNLVVTFFNQRNRPAPS